MAVRRRGHEVSFIGDTSVERALEGLGLEVQVLPPELDLGPRLVAAIREAMASSGGDSATAGPLVEGRLAAWAREASIPVAEAISAVAPAAVITSLFGVEVVQESRPNRPWAVVNSTFYIGPNPPRPIEQDIAPRAVPLVSRYSRLLEKADMVLHATDQTFDFSFDRLPDGNHYVGPLGLWEPEGQAPTYLAEPGDPWVLVSISSQLQDDLPLAEAALRAMEGRQVRVLLTVGPGHQPSEVESRPANARIEQVVPHSAVLQRGMLLVSHAGHGSVMKALWAGVPMVLMPWGRDQPGVAARAQALGVAEVVQRGDGDTDALTAAIDRALSSTRMRERAQVHAARLQGANPPATAADLLESLVG